MTIKNFSFTILLFLTIPIFSFGQINNIKEAINKAGRQRMLSQKIAKDYMFVGIGEYTTEATEEMEKSIALFESQLDELLEFAPNESIKIEFEKIKFSWSYFKKIVNSPPTKSNAVKIIDYSNRLLDESNYAVKVLTKYSNQRSGEIINISGRQRMLSQRIALYFAAYKWKVPHGEILSRFKKAKDLFQTSLKKLMKNKTNSAGINLYLKIVKSQFKFSRKGFNVNGDLSLEEIFIFTNEITATMNTITGMYESTLK